MIKKKLDKNGFLDIDFYRIFTKFMIIVNKELLWFQKMKRNNKPLNQSVNNCLRQLIRLPAAR